MNKVTDQQRDQKYETSSEIQRHLYASSASGEQLWKIATKHQLTEDETYTDFVVAVGDVVLGFYTSVQLPQLLTERIGADPKKALTVTADVLDFLEPLTTGKITDLSENKEKAAVPPKPGNTVVSNDELAAEIAKTEEALVSIPQMRTMAEDMQQTKSNPAETPTYSNTQEAILREGKPNNSPRWGEV